MKVTHETADGIVVTLECIVDPNALGTVYRLTSTLGGQGWSYGRGDTECIESLTGLRPFHLLANNFIAWQRRQVFAIAIGKSTVAGPELKAKLESMILELGPYPHGKINLSGRKKQTTRLIKQECLNCGYIVRSSQKCIDENGPVMCPCNHERMELT